MIDESVKRENAVEILKEFEVNNIGSPRNEIDRRRSHTRSLSSLCESLLGLPLDKREQLFVWTRRPLRALQVRIIGKIIISSAEYSKLKR